MCVEHAARMQRSELRSMLVGRAFCEGVETIRSFSSFVLLAAGGL
jgi:hypothetical protein